jgi:hypothetical protein
LVQVLTDWESTEAVPVNVLYAPSARRLPRVRAFTDFATELFNDLERDRGRLVVGTERPAWMRRPHGRASDFEPRPLRPGTSLRLRETI